MMDAQVSQSGGSSRRSSSPRAQMKMPLPVGSPLISSPHASQKTRRADSTFESVGDRRKAETVAIGPAAVVVVRTIWEPRCRPSPKTKASASCPLGTTLRSYRCIYRCTYKSESTQQNLTWPAVELIKYRRAYADRSTIDRRLITTQPPR